MIKEKYDFDFFQDLPIDEVADYLGMDKGRGENYRSPLHEDKNPSLTLQLNPNKKYFNYWKDWSLNEGGRAIELTMAVRYGISPSQYWANKTEYRPQLKECLHFLNEYFPGGITIIKDDDKARKMPQIPIIPNEIIEMLGLKRNPLFDNKVVSMKQLTTNYGLSQSEAEMFKNSFFINYPLPLADRALILIDKFTEYKRSLVEYSSNIFANFPELDENACNVIASKTTAWMDKIQPYVEKLQDFYLEMSEIEYPSLDFEHEEASVYEMNKQDEYDELEKE